MTLKVMQVSELANSPDGDEQSIMLVVSTSSVLCNHTRCLQLRTVIVCWSKICVHTHTGLCRSAGHGTGTVREGPGPSTQSRHGMLTIKSKRVRTF